MACTILGGGYLGDLFDLFESEIRFGNGNSSFCIYFRDLFLALFMLLLLLQNTFFLLTTFVSRGRVSVRNVRKVGCLIQGRAIINAKTFFARHCGGKIELFG